MTLPVADSRIELSLSALRRNLRFLRGLVGQERRMYAVVKGNAYGHGIESFVPMLHKCGVRHFATSSAYEALRTFRVCPDAEEIMVMCSVNADEQEWAIEHGISSWIYTYPKLLDAQNAARKLGRPARIHLELETGLHRNGLQGEELDRVVATLRSHPEDFLIEGTCTHFAGAESVANHLRIGEQRRALDEGVQWLEKQGIGTGLKHSACSAAALVMPETRGEAVRIGISLYGFWPSRETEMKWLLEEPERLQSRSVSNPLRRVMRWSTRLLAVNKVPPGAFVGYGTSFQASRTTKIATVPIGYSKGYARSLSNRGHMLVRGRRAPVVGVVNMNITMLDVTDIPGAQPGDEAVMIGKQGRRSITVGSFSDLTRDLNYEVLLRLTPEIPRIQVP